jgi:tight adherence protein B
MALLVLIVFVSAFAVVALLMMAGATDDSSSSKRALAAIVTNPFAGKEKIREHIGDLRKNAMLSAIPWMNRWLQRFELAPRVRLLLYQAEVKWTTGGLLLMCAACFTISTYLIDLRTGNMVVSLPIGVFLGFAPLMFVYFKRSRRFEKFEQGLPEALDLMVSALRAGHSFNAALGLVTRECQEPVRSEFRVCFDEQNYGLELRGAMDNLSIRVPLPDLRIAITAILIQKETGGNLAEVLNKTSEVIRERFRLKRQVRVHTAHGRMTGMVVGSLPIVLLILLYFINPDMESVLWKRELGIKLLYAAGGMMLVGCLIIRKIVNMEV